MSDLLQLVPIYAFMLIPVWIPMAAVAFGALIDVVKAPAKVVAPHPSAAPAHSAGRRISSAGPRVAAAGTSR